MLFITRDNWKTLFFIQIYRQPELWLNRHITVFFETSVLKEVRVLYPLSPQQHCNATTTKYIQQSFHFLNMLIAFFHSFSL